jgi:hypothetical protein
MDAHPTVMLSPLNSLYYRPRPRVFKKAGCGVMKKLKGEDEEEIKIVVLVHVDLSRRKVLDTHYGYALHDAAAKSRCVMM